MTYNQFTKEDVNERLKDKMIQLSGEYINTKADTEFTCLICGEKFISKYERIIAWRGIGCKKCKGSQSLTSGEKLNRKREKLFREKSESVEIVSYDETINRIICKCLLCGENYETSYNSLIYGHGHRGCSLKEYFAKAIMSKEIVMDRVLSYGNDIDIDFSNYKSSTSLLDCHCNVCGNDWKTRQRNLIRGRGCPVCANEKRRKSKFLPLEHCQKVLSSFNLELIGEYEAVSYPITVKCKKCQNIFSTSITYLKNTKIGCVNCNNIIRTNEKSKSFSDSIIKLNPKIKMIDEFVSMSSPTTFYCVDCRKTFIRSPHDFTRTPTCPNCTTNSALEYMVKIFLNNNHINYEPHKSFDNLFGVNGGKLSYDFYLYDYNLLIECQGEQHEKANEYFGGEEQLKIQKEHDCRKRVYAQDNKINFIEIWYYDTKNIEKILCDTLHINNNHESA